jgi:hypothetical protein
MAVSVKKQPSRPGGHQPGTRTPRSTAWMHTAPLVQDQCRSQQDSVNGIPAVSSPANRSPLYLSADAALAFHAHTRRDDTGVDRERSQMNRSAPATAPETCHPARCASCSEAELRPISSGMRLSEPYERSRSCCNRYMTESSRSVSPAVAGPYLAGLSSTLNHSRIEAAWRVRCRNLTAIPRRACSLVLALGADRQAGAGVHPAAPKALVGLDGRLVACSRVACSLLPDRR